METIINSKVILNKLTYLNWGSLCNVLQPKALFADSLKLESFTILATKCKILHPSRNNQVQINVT